MQYIRKPKRHNNIVSVHKRKQDTTKIMESVTHIFVSVRLLQQKCVDFHISPVQCVQTKHHCESLIYRVVQKSDNPVLILR